MDEGGFRVCMCVYVFFFSGGGGAGRAGGGIELSLREGIFFETEKQRIRRLLGAY